MIEKIKLGYPVLDRRFDFDREELSSIELTARITNSLNTVIDIVNDWQGSLDKHELSDDITDKRKLSPTGNFTGTLMGRLVSLVLADIADSKNKILYLTNQFADGQTGLVIDGGFFEASGIDKNYDGGRF